METIPLQELLLADDDADDRQLFEEALNQVSPGCHLTVANNGVELMHILDKKVPDMLFLDINMPLKNGIDCIKWIRELKKLKKLVVIAYSSAFDISQINKAYAFGVHLYFIKPTRMNYLVEDLKRLFELNWDDPNTVTSSHFIRNSYIPFNGNRE
jgi:DNA-binding NtrC family response regulator